MKYPEPEKMSKAFVFARCPASFLQRIRLTQVLILILTSSSWVSASANERSGSQSADQWGERTGDPYRCRRAGVTGNYRYSVGVWPSEGEHVITFSLSDTKLENRNIQTVTGAGMWDAVTMKLFKWINTILQTKLWPDRHRKQITGEKSREKVALGNCK